MRTISLLSRRLKLLFFLSGKAVGALFIRSLCVFVAIGSCHHQSMAQGNDYSNTYKGLLGNDIGANGKWSTHFQFTSIWQAHPGFYSDYSGKNSLHPGAEKNLSVTSTLLVGRRLWRGASVFVNAEIAGGGGLSSALGLAGAANGETFRVGNPAPALYLARGYFEQIVYLKRHAHSSDGSEENNATADSSKITITAGKFSLADFFDDNAYSHDPRSEFMNWGLMDNGAWDYPANTRGYTSGVVVELNTRVITARVSAVLVPKIANSEIFDYNIRHARGQTAEIERIYKIHGLPGNIRLLGYINYSPAPPYSTATRNLQSGDSLLAKAINGLTTSNLSGQVKYGFGISFNQSLSKTLGIFSRAGWNDGTTATWAFTEIDRTISAGIRIIPAARTRPGDHIGVAVLVNGISSEHRNYLNAGGYGFIIGDGKLSNYATEQILETYYKVKLSGPIWISADYQFVQNPAYNRQRGPVNIFAVRVHVEL